MKTGAGQHVKQPSRDDDAAALNCMIEDLEGIIERAKRRRVSRIAINQLEAASTDIKCALLAVLL